MRRRSIVLALLPVVLGIPLCAQRVVLPDTAPAQRLQKFVQAFNSGSQGRMRKFIAESYTPEALAQRGAESRSGTYLLLFEQTRGFRLRGVVVSEPKQISAVAQAKLTEDWWLITLALDAASQDRVAGMVFRATPRPPEFTPHARLTASQVAAALSAYVDRLAKAGLFSGVVLVAAPDGAPLLQKTVGDTADGRRITMQTPFGLASITKTFTAVAVAQLADAGKLSFEDCLGKFFPAYPKPAAGQITVRELLTHTAGLPVYMGPRYFDKPRSIQEHADVIGGIPLSFPPGTKFQYSNAGYILLRGVVIAASGQSFQSYLQQHIFAPAGIESEDDSAMTASDLLRFSVALRGGKLLSPTMLKTVTTGQVSTGEPGVRYAYGFEERTVNGERLVGHAGGAPRVSAHFDMYDNGYTVVILSDRPGAPAGQIALRAADLITQK